LRRGADPRVKHSGGFSAIELAHNRGHEAAAIFLETWRAAGRPEVPNRCPLICVTSEYAKGCVAGCTVPASSTSPVSVEGGEMHVGYWLRGSGPDGTIGDDGHFEVRIRRVIERKPVDCSFGVDATTLGPRIQACGESFGAVRVTVLPQ
jgi:hypothetical protein